MNTTPKSLRTQIGIFGRTNVGKSSVMNMLSHQEISIVSEISGTTTDVVSKAAEIIGLGACVLHDTAGIDDESELGAKRIERALEVIDIIDAAILVVANNTFGEYENSLIVKFNEQKKPFLILINKCDQTPPNADFLASLSGFFVLQTSAKTELNKDEIFNALIKIAKPSPLKSLFEGILKGGEVVLLITPIDAEAPAGRLILPQVQAIRQILDAGAYAFVSKFSNVEEAVKKLRPDLIVCDSQVVKEVVNSAPKDVKITTFSILMSRLKGDLGELVRGAKAIENLKDADKILIAEACTHNIKDGDIARVKIPAWLRKFSGKELNFVYTNGKDYPANLEEFALIIHCGGCMINKNMMTNRIERAKIRKIPISNYGVIISLTQNVLSRVLEIFGDEIETNA